VEKLLISCFLNQHFLKNVLNVEEIFFLEKTSLKVCNICMLSYIGFRLHFEPKFRPKPKVYTKPKPKPKLIPKPKFRPKPKPKVSDHYLLLYFPICVVNLNAIQVRSL
jgi:hypothetical protein